MRRKDAILPFDPDGGLKAATSMAERYEIAHVPLDSATLDCSLPTSLQESLEEASEGRAESLLPGGLSKIPAVWLQVPIHLRSTTAQRMRPPTSCPIDVLSLDVLCEILVLVLGTQHPATSNTSCASMATLQNVGSGASRNVNSLLTLTHVCHLWRQALHGMPWLWRELTLIWRPGMRNEGHARPSDVEGATRIAHGGPRSAQIAHASTSSQNALWLARAATMPLSFTVVADPRRGLSGMTWGRPAVRDASDDVFCVNYVVELFRDPICFPSHRIHTLRLVLLAQGHVAALASLPPASFPELEALYLNLNHNRWPSPEDAPITVFANSLRLRRVCLKVVWNAGAVEQRLDLPWSSLTHLSLELPGSTRSAYLNIIRLCRDSLVWLQVVEGHMLRLTSTPLAELETPIHLPRLCTLRFPSSSTCLLALDPVNLSELHVDTASAPVLDASLQRAVHVSSLSLSHIIIQGNELRRLLGSLPSLHSLSLDQCSLRFDLFFASLVVGIRSEGSCMQGSVYVPCLESLRMVTCRNGTEALDELDIDLFSLMIRSRCPCKDEKGTGDTMVMRYIRFVEMWPMRPSFAEKCRRDWEGRGELVVVLEQPWGSSIASGMWKGF